MNPSDDQWRKKGALCTSYPFDKEQSHLSFLNRLLQLYQDSTKTSSLSVRYCMVAEVSLRNLLKLIVGNVYSAMKGKFAAIFVNSKLLITSEM